MNPTTCILCGKTEVLPFFKDNDRDYLQCSLCKLIFVPLNQRLSHDEEVKRYNLHQNSPKDKGYRDFLNRIFKPMNSLIPPNSYGLDFGSGPGPTLNLMFTDNGHKMEIYDPFYAKDHSVFDKKYDFITATEVVEHLFNPKKELDLLWSCLKPKGILGIMTKLAPDKEMFASWHYKRDLTHVCFFSRPTFTWLANKWQSKVDFIDKDVVIFHKK